MPVVDDICVSPSLRMGEMLPDLMRGVCVCEWEVMNEGQIEKQKERSNSSRVGFENMGTDAISSFH